MVSLLIISHSAHIAHGIKELASQMAQGRVKIAAAGGTLDGALGTSTDVIAAALETIRSPDGILVLVDLGSAIMSAEMALEISGERFLISKAPIVEGALVAAVQASGGATLEQVAAAAERALEAKIVAEQPAARQASLLPPPLAVPSVTLTIDHAAGLHMRPATLFVQTASRFRANVQVKNLERPGAPSANARSMIQVMKLGVSQGHRVEVSAEGDEADAALAALEELVRTNFGEG